MTNEEAERLIRRVIREYANEPADVIGRRKTADAIRSAGVVLIDGDDAVAIGRDYKTVVCLADGRKLVAYYPSPVLELVTEWRQDAEIIPTPEFDLDAPIHGDPDPTPEGA